MKTFKRNAVILTVVLFVCVAAYLNWSYNRNIDDDTDVIGTPPAQNQQATTTPAQGEAAAPDAGLFYSPEAEAETVPDFFAATRISRRQARDAAVETLATVTSSQGASQDIIDAALEKISGIASVSAKEAELESLIMAKGFSDCVVFISDDGVKVTVPAPMEGLSLASVAQITDVITAETEYKAVDMQIIEVK